MAFLDLKFGIIAFESNCRQIWIHSLQIPPSFFDLLKFFEIQT